MDDPLERRLGRFVQENRDYAIFLLDATGHVLTWNAGAQRIKGYAAQDILGRHFSTFYTLEDKSSMKPTFELRVATETGRYEEEGWRVRKDGSMFWANVVITAQKDPDGALLGFAKITRDMTERRQAEEALRRSEERYRLLLDSVHDHAIFSLDGNGRISSWNAAAQRIKGYSTEEVIGRHFSIFYTPEDLARGHPANELAIAARTGRYEEEGWRVRKDGSRFFANVVISAARDAQGRLVGYSKVTRDLTERHMAASTLEARDRRMRAVMDANRELESFSYMVAHDLRNPLSGIAALADMLATDPDRPVPDGVREDLRRIQRGAERAGRLVEDLLNFGRAAEGDLRLEEVDLTQMVRHVVKGLREREPARAVALDAQEGMRVRADAGLLRIAMDNLLGNAWKFTRGKPDARIRVTLETQGRATVVRVEDNGAGFDPARSDRLFKPFSRLHAQSEFEGTGVGLATVARIVERHGGRVEAAGAPGRGATFTLCLPGLDG